MSGLVPIMSLSTHVELELGYDKRTCKRRLINETEIADIFSLSILQPIDCDKTNLLSFLLIKKIVKPSLNIFFSSLYFG